MSAITALQCSAALLLLVTSACARTAANARADSAVAVSPDSVSGASTRGTTVAPAASAGWSVRMERGPCHGTCPVYTVEIQGDGTVLFNGIRNVAAMGAQKGSVTPDALKRLQEQFRLANFATLPHADSDTSSTCRPYATDLPTVTTVVRDGATSHSVRHDHGCRGAPPILNTLEQLVDGTSNTMQWIKSSKTSDQ